MRRITLLITALATALAVLAPAAVATSSATDTEPLVPVFGAGDGGEVTLTRRANSTFTWKLEATGFDPGHAYTVWVGNFLDGRVDENGVVRTWLNDGGFGGSGLVGASGTINAAGNHCIGVLDPANPLGEDGGFVPGTAPDCDYIDQDGQIVFYLIDHGPWASGEQDARRTPVGGGFEGLWFAYFGPVAP